MPRVMWVDEKEGVLGMEKVEGCSVREILGGGAEGEVEVEQDDEELEVEEGMDKLEVETHRHGADEEESEGWTALKRLGVTRGE